MHLLGTIFTAGLMHYFGLQQCRIVHRIDSKQSSMCVCVAMKEPSTAAWLTAVFSVASGAPQHRGIRYVTLCQTMLYWGDQFIVCFCLFMGLGFDTNNNEDYYQTYLLKCKNN